MNLLLSTLGHDRVLKGTRANTVDRSAAIKFIYSSREIDRNT